jgi:hypothetical protein
LVERRNGIQQQVEKIDMGEALEGVVKGFYIDKSKIVDEVPA